MNDPLKATHGIYAEFPAAEYQARILRIRAEMAKAGIDAAILTASENIRYFAGGPLSDLYVDSYNIFYLIIPTNSALEPILLMSSGREGSSRTSWIRDRRFWGYDQNASIISQSLNISTAVDAVKKLGLAQAVLGMELDCGQRLGMTLKEAQEFQALLPAAKFHPLSEIVWGLREIKSPAEMERLRRASTITCRAFEQGFEALRPGVTELEIASIVRASMFAQGATGAGFLSLFGGWERGLWADASPSNYALRKGDFVMFDGGCTVDGYYADISRMASIGEPRDADYLLYEYAREAHAAGVAACRVGTTMAALFAAANDVFDRRGVGHLKVLGCGQLGHGIGLNLHERPDVSSLSENRLQAGMVIAVEPAISDKPVWQESSIFYIVESNIQITDDGPEILTGLSDKLYIA